MLTEATDRATIQEQYVVAQNTSDLTVDPEHRTAADVIIAAGTSNTLLSAALTSLRSEWERTPKVQKKTEEEIQALAATYPKKGKPDVKRARVECMVWHARQLREQARRLRSREKVMELLTPWVIAKGLDTSLIWTTVFHWLAPACPACDGRGAMRMADAPVLGRQCLHCNGTKVWPEPRGAADIKGYIEDAVHNATRTMKGKLR